MIVGGGRDKVAAACARRGSFLRTGVQSGGLAGQGWKSRPPTGYRPRRRLPGETEKTGRGRPATCQTVPSGRLRGSEEKRAKGRCGSRKMGALRESWGTAKNRVQDTVCL